MRRLLRGTRPEPALRLEAPEERAAAFASSGQVLAPPVEGTKGIFLVNGTRLRLYTPLADEVRSDYATVLIHFWEIGPERLGQYRAAARLVARNRPFDGRRGHTPPDPC